MPEAGAATPTVACVGAVAVTVAVMTAE